MKAVKEITCFFTLIKINFVCTKMNFWKFSLPNNPTIYRRFAKQLFVFAVIDSSYQIGFLTRLSLKQSAGNSFSIAIAEFGYFGDIAMTRRNWRFFKHFFHTVKIKMIIFVALSHLRHAFITRNKYNSNNSILQ